MNRIAWAVLIAIYLGASLSRAEVPMTFSYQGRLLESDSITPQTGNVDFKLQILDPSGACLLYEEKQAGVALTENGLFSLQVGSPLASSKRSDIDPGLSMEKVFSNQNSAVRNPGGTGCLMGYIPGAHDIRKLKVVVKVLRTGEVSTLTPFQEIVMNPFALQAGHSDTADSLNGKKSQDFIQVDNASVTQSNVKSLTDKASDILSLLTNGNSVTNGSVTTALGYTPLSPANNLNDLVSVSSARTNLGLGTSAVRNVPTVGNASSSELVKGDDTRLSDSRNPIGSAGGDLTGSYPNPALGAVGTAGTYTKVTTDSKGRVTNGSLISIADIKSTFSGNFLTASGACPSGQQLTYLSVSDTLSCQAYSITSSQISSALGFTPADNANMANYVAKAGATMTGALVLPANGLVVGTNQLTVSGGNVGIGTDNPGQKFEVNGNIKGTQLCIGSDCRASWPAEGGGGSANLNVATVTADYTATAANDLILANASSASVAVTLPPAAGNSGKQIYVKKIDTSSNQVQILPASGELLDGLNCTALTNQRNGSLKLVSDGSAWWGVESYNGFAVQANPGKTVFSYTGSLQTFEVPSCVTSITVKVWGAGGGGVASNSAGGAGAAVVSTLAVTPGEILNVVVGEGGARGGAAVTTPATFGGGGAGGYAPSYPGGGAGGGRSAVGRASADIITAAGGAGSARDCAGPAGGITTGVTGANGGNTTGGAGGTQSTGGAAGNGSPASTAGSLYQGGSAGGVVGATSTVGGGGGGGGYYGGGGGGSYTGGSGGGSCGGSGSSLVPAGGTGYAGSTVNAGNNSDIDYVTGVGVGGASSVTKGGNGLVVISW